MFLVKLNKFLDWFKKMTKYVRGTRDIFGKDAEKFRFVEEVCRKTVQKYGFREIILPTFEEISLYVRSVGDTTDIVEKQMYEFEDKKGRKLVLRPEGTAGVVRAFIEHNLKDVFALKRFFYYGSMFRYERPQKGRYREFYQFGMEIFNEGGPAGDVFLIKCICEIINFLSIKNRLYINSVGCDVCRKKYREYLVEILRNMELCEDCVARLDRNPLRVLDCKIDSHKVDNIKGMTEFLCDSCGKEYSEIRKFLSSEKIDFVEDKLLVRGLDYYTGFVFEFKGVELDAAQSTICAGGRYNNLVKSLGGEDVVSCGAAFGIDRIVGMLNEGLIKNKKVRVGISVVSDEYLSVAFKIFDSLENKEFVLLGPFSGKSLKSQLRIFNNEGCNYAIIVGEECANGEVVVKNLKENVQKILKIEEVIKELV